MTQEEDASYNSHVIFDRRSYQHRRFPKTSATLMDYFNQYFPRICHQFRAMLREMYSSLYAPKLAMIVLSILTGKTLRRSPFSENIPGLF